MKRNHFERVAEVARLQQTVGVAAVAKLQEIAVQAEFLRIQLQAGQAVASRRHRRGSNLIEMLVAIAATAVVLGTMTVTLFTMLRADRQVREELELSSVLGRLELQLRTDAHAAAGAEIPGGSPGSEPPLRFHFSEARTVEYISVPRQIERVERRRETVVHRDTFALPTGTTATWNIIQAAAEQILTVQLTSLRVPKTRRNVTFEPTIRIESVIGRDHQFTQIQER